MRGGQEAARAVALLMSAGTLMGASTPGQAVKPAKFQRNGWVTYCREGDDGFAVSCEASKLGGDYVFRLRTVDAQLVQSVEHVRCEVEPRSFPRDEVAGLSARQRQLQTIQTFDLLSLDVAGECPKLPPVPRTFLNPPDIAVAGDEVLR